MKKQSITISVPNNITQEEIKEIRQLFKNNLKYKEFRLNIIVSGYHNFQQNLTEFLKVRIIT